MMNKAIITTLVDAIACWAISMRFSSMRFRGEEMLADRAYINLRDKSVQCLLAAQNEAFWAGVISKEIDTHVEAHAECRRLLWRQGVGEHRPVIEMMLQHEEAIMRKKGWLR